MDKEPDDAYSTDSEEKSKSNADIICEVIEEVLRDIMRRNGLGREAAKEVFVTAFRRRAKWGTLPQGYDPSLDASHPIHGWQPEG